MPLKLLCDENVPRAVDGLLRTAGHDVARVSSGVADADVARLAQEGKHILITFDSDFSNILRYPPQEYFGIIRLRIEPPFIDDIMRALGRVFGQFQAQEDFRGILVIAEPHTFRVWRKSADDEESESRPTPRR